MPSAIHIKRPRPKPWLVVSPLLAEQTFTCEACGRRPVAGDHVLMESRQPTDTDRIIECSACTKQEIHAGTCNHCHTAENPIDTGGRPLLWRQWQQRVGGLP